MNKILLLVFGCLVLLSCDYKETADLLVYNAHVYTVDSTFNKAEAFVVKDGKFLEIGSADVLREKYDFAEVLDVQGKAVFPGLIDAHAHFFGLGQNQNQVDLVGTESFDEVISRVQEFQKENNSDYIIGRGWDQNDWELKEWPEKSVLDSLFPDVPVALTRIDGHAMLVNTAALDRANIDENTPAEGGEIQKNDGRLTGVLVDNPMILVEDSFPKEDKKRMTEALKKAEEICLQYGLTTVDDAGLDRAVIELIDSLQKAGELKMRLYAMISNTPENLDHYLAGEPYKTDRLNVRSVKFYGDGALGSRGAALKEEYSDQANHFGALLSPVADFQKTAERIAKTSFQMNTHAIGDSANYAVLKTYDSLLKNTEDRRWRVEHSQVIDSSDFTYFSMNIIPSVQPTHATSDMYWAEDRLGEERIKGAYAYKQLLDQAGIVALGTDFPVEQVNPFLTFYASVARMDTENYPEDGFNSADALSREETLKGMTIWAAYSNFEEKEKGSIEPGKFADFVILDRDIMQVDISTVPETVVISTFINGEEVYQD